MHRACRSLEYVYYMVDCIKDPESFVRGGPTFITIFFVDEGEGGSKKI